MRTLVMLAATLLWGCGTSATTTDGPCSFQTASVASDVLLDYYTFVPRCFRVTTGTTVHFLNIDTVLYSVVTDAGQAESFDSGTIPPGGVWSHVFASEGDIGMHCGDFVQMTATVFVRPPP